MDNNKYCSICPKKSYWNIHINVPYIIKETTYEVE